MSADTFGQPQLMLQINIESRSYILDRIHGHRRIKMLNKQHQWTRLCCLSRSEVVEMDIPNLTFEVNWTSLWNGLVPLALMAPVNLFFFLTLSLHVIAHLSFHTKLSSHSVFHKGLISCFTLYILVCVCFLLPSSDHYNSFFVNVYSLIR
jgi:hypothetical protein